MALTIQVVQILVTTLFDEAAHLEHFTRAWANVTGAGPGKDLGGIAYGTRLFRRPRSQSLSPFHVASR